MEEIKKKVLVLGSSGMLGHMVSSYLNSHNRYEIFNLSRRSIGQINNIICDITDLNKFDKIINTIKPQVVVNCIGLLINESKNNFEQAKYINSYLPKHLIKISNNRFRVIHISTDCVFSGKHGSYNEYSKKDANDAYGITKSDGEFDLPKHLTIRTSIIGPDINKDGSGLFQWLLNQRGKVKGFSNVKWSGVTTLELSKAIDFAINNSIDGLWNLSNQEEISKFELLKIIINLFELDQVTLTKDSSIKSNKSLVSVRKIKYIVPSYTSMITELKEFICTSNSYKKNFLK